MDKTAEDEIERLILELKDDRRDVRSRAAYELGKHNDPRTVAPLIAALSDNDKFVRSWSAGALAKAGPSAIAPLVDALDTPDPAVGYYVALALGELGDLRAIPLLAQALHEGDWDVRPSAACTLANLGDSSTLPDRIVTEPGLSGADRAKILASLREVNYTDDQVQIHLSIPDVSEFCRQRSQSADDAIRMGAVETLQALGTSVQPDAANAHPAHTEPSAQTASRSQPPVAEPEPAAERKASETPRTAVQEAEKPKRSLWDRLTGR